MSAIVAGAESEDLEALFDSIIHTKVAPAVAATPGDALAKEHGPRADIVSIVKPAPASAAAPGDGQGVESGVQGDVMSRVGNLTRTLHDALRELGYDRALEKTAASIPDARDRLDYVVKMTEQAAVRALNSIETAQPIQDRLGEGAKKLDAQWKRLFDKQMSVDEFKKLVDSTRDYLADVPKQTQATNAQLLEIMMAQDFQDLTGQVIKKITALAQNMEQQLVQLLVDLVPSEMRCEINAGLLNGPVVNAVGRTDVVTDQNQVDDLLGSLGF